LPAASVIAAGAALNVNVCGGVTLSESVTDFVTPFAVAVKMTG
jgi:hypothetical protein